jgi:hypothetical protein
VKAGGSSIAGSDANQHVGQSGLDTVVRAWHRWHDPHAEMVFVADRSLKHFIGPANLRRWSRLVDTYSLIEALVADEVILEIARDRGLHIITCDH